LQNSGTSSQEETSASLSPKGPTRKRFALTGVSAPVDPRVDAVRGDLADIRLADRVFAPHYASPMPRALARAVALRAGPFEVLELAGINAWGVAATPRLVGYIDADALGEAPGA
jgi:hypothetical protein